MGNSRVDFGNWQRHLGYMDSNWPRINRELADRHSASGCHVVTYGEVHGQTMYAGKQLAAVPQIFDRLGPPGVTCVSMKHADSGELRIRQVYVLRPEDNY